MDLSPELDTLECLAAEDMSLRTAWRQYSSTPTATLNGFSRFLDAWTNDGSITARTQSGIVPRWRLYEILACPDSDDAQSVVLSLTDIGMKRYEG